MADIEFDLDFESTIPPTVVVKHPEWCYRMEDTELWTDGFYHPVYVPYCKVEFVQNPLLVFPLDDFVDF